MLFQRTPAHAASARTYGGESRAVRVTYWISTVLVAANWTVGGVLSVMHATSSMNVFHRLGYPPYFATLLGVAQLCGVIAILAPVPKTLREWAYAGFTFDVCAAIVSIVATGSSFADVLIPIMALGIVLTSHYAWQLRVRVGHDATRRSVSTPLATV